MWKRTTRPDLIDWEYVVREKFVIRFTKNRVYALDGATMATIAGSMVGVVLRTVGQQRPMRRRVKGEGELSVRTVGRDTRGMAQSIRCNDGYREEGTSSLLSSLFLFLKII